MEVLHKVWFRHTGMGPVDMDSERTKTIKYSSEEIHDMVGEENSITHLKVDGNLPPDIRELAPDVTHLYVKRIEAKSCLDRLSDLSKIEKLKISDTNIKSLPDSIASLTSLKELVLRDNGLTRHLKSRRRDAAGRGAPYENSPLSKDHPRNLSHLTELTKLEISNDQELDGVPDVIHRIPSLTELVLSECGLQRLPHCLSQLKLKKLDVSGNGLEADTVEDVICSLTSLSELNLSRCDIITLPDRMSNMADLTKLHLSENKIVELPSYFSELKKLCHVDLRNNSELLRLTKSILMMAELKRIQTAGCSKLVSPPSDVCKRGAASVVQYYRDLEQGSIEELPMVTIAVIGKSLAGKTSLIRTLQNEDNRRVLTGRGPDASTDETTRVFNVEEVKVGRSTLKFIDFGGNEIYQLAYGLTLKQNCLPVIVVNMEDFEKECTEMSDVEAVRSLFFNWMSQLYLSHPDLDAPKIVLTHQDIYCDPNKFGEMKRRFLDACRGMLQGVLEDDKAKETLEQYKMCRAKSLPDFFRDEDIFVIGNSEGDMATYIRLKEVLQRASEKFTRTVPKVWHGIDEELRRLIGAFYPLDEVCHRLQEKFQISRDQLEIILQYMHDCGKLLWYREKESLKGYVFINISAVTQMISVLYSHDRSVWPQLFQKLTAQCGGDLNAANEVQCHKASYSKFCTSGFLSEKLLYTLLKSETRFKEHNEVGVALLLLKLFHLLHGPEVFEEEAFYILPFYSLGYLNTHLRSSNQQKVKFRIELQFQGLSLPHYVYYQMTIGLLKFCGEGSEPVVKQNGAKLNTEDSNILLIHNFKARKSVLQISTTPEKAAVGWNQLKDITNDVITHVTGFWSASRIVCKVFCPHCLMEKNIHPHKVINPDWCALPGVPRQSIPCGEREERERPIPPILLHPPKGNFFGRRRLADDELEQLTSYITQQLNHQVDQPGDEEYTQALEDLPLEDAEEPDVRHDDDSSDNESITPEVADADGDGYQSGKSDISEPEPFPPRITDRIINVTLKPTMRRSVQDMFLDNDKFYEMTSPVRGRALLVNNYRYPTHPREGSQYDVQNMKSLLEKLGLEVELKEDLTKQRLLWELVAETRHPHHEDYGIFFFLFFGHGGENNTIYGIDDQPVSLRDVYSALNRTGFHAMAGKPKVVIIQACRRDNPADGATSSRPVNAATSQSTSTVQPPRSQPSVSLNIDDFLIFKSCFEYQYSLRYPSVGSPFIRSIVTTLAKHGCHRDLVELFEIVRDRVHRQTDQQMAIVTNTLTKRRGILLFPEYNGE